MRLIKDLGVSFFVAAVVIGLGGAMSAGFVEWLDRAPWFTGAQEWTQAYFLVVWGTWIGMGFHS